MALWEKLEMDDKLIKLLKEIPPGANAEDFGPAYVTIDQLAVVFDLRYPEVRQELDVTLGGRSGGRHTSLVDYLATELVPKIKRYGDVYPIEAAQLSSVRFREIRLNGPGGRDLVGTSKADLPLIRLRPKEPTEPTE
jgi:hypothetical protein